MISLEYEACNGNLSTVISSFYRFQYRGGPRSETERADRAQFRFYLKGQGEYRFGAGNVDPSHDVTIVGPTSRSCETWTDSDVTIFGWGITPAGWSALMGAEADKWTDRAFDARMIFGDSVLEMLDSIKKCESLKEQVAVAKMGAAIIYKDTDTSPFEFTKTVDKWLIESLDPNLNDLVSATGLSIRQLERNTKKFYGMPPKKLARKYRALRTAQMLSHGDSLDESEIGTIYHDQSHLIREVKQFTGLTPSQLKSGASELTNATIKGRKALSGKVNPLISDS